MNLLIIGGLLGVTLLAIIGIVVLVMGESRAQNSSSPSPASARTTRRLEPEPAITREVSEIPAPTQQRSLAPRETTTGLPSMSGAHSVARLNGQIHELVNELRTLHQQAGELEQRLQVLTEVVERIEQAQSRQVSVEEEETLRISPPDDRLT